LNTIKLKKSFKGMIAHRGLSGLETENTINAFIAAANRSYFGMECDVFASKDGKIIITHDDTLSRLGMLDLYIPSFTYEEIRKFPLLDRKTGILSSNICIPLLSELLVICKMYRKHGLIELKDNLTFKNIDTLIAEIKQFDVVNSVSIIAFSEDYLLYIKNNYPEIDSYLLTEEINDRILCFCEHHHINLDVLFEVLDAASVLRLHTAELKVCVWTVDEKETAQALIEMGVDYITSNILE
jgi:glycerophosphoryl diester phosphodiesterase